MKILGFSGDIRQGMKELEDFIQYSEKNNRILYDEAKLMHTFLLVYLDTKKEKAWTIAQSLPTKEHLFNTFLVADIAFRTGHSDFAIQTLENRPKSKEYEDFYFLDYLLGILKLNRLDEDADQYIGKFVNHFKGKHYIKDAYQKLAWCHLLKKDRAKHQECMNNCESKGYKLVDADKQAHKNAVSNVVPNVDLLKARLLFDGGYYKKAIAILQKKNKADFSTQKEQLEFIYRYGRIYEGLGKYNKSIDYYEQTIEKSTDSSDYFAPKACLQLGKIYEGQNKASKATVYYKKCMAYTGYEYKDSFDQQAKAGLNRLKK